MSAFCYKGISDITFKNEADEKRFNELASQLKGNKDAAYELLLREKAGETISSASSLFDRDSQLVEDTLASLPLEDNKDVEKIQKVVTNQIAALNKRINDLKQSAARLKGVDKADRNNTIEGLEDLLEELSELEIRDQFITLVDYSNTEMNRTLEWLNRDAKDKGFDPSKSVHRDTYLALGRQLDTYAGLNVPQYAAKHSVLREKIVDINRIHAEIKEAMFDARDGVIKDLMKESSNEKFKDEKNLEDYLRESNDIDGLQALLIDIDTSTDPLLGVIGKKYANSRQEVHELVSEFKERAFAAGRKLVDAGIEGFDWMVNKDTGNIITRLSDEWKTKLAEVFSVTDGLEVGDNGKKVKRQYIKKDNSLLTDDERKHNIELAADKKTIAQFLRAEYWDKDLKQLVNGENKQYTKAFKAARDIHEVYEEGGWQKSAAVSDEDYNKYLKRYYGPKVTAWRLVYEDEEVETSPGKFITVTKPTGEVEEYETRFVKDAYTEVNAKWNSKQYNSIMENDAQREFYEFYTEAYSELMDKLPADIAKRMDGKVLRIKDDFTTNLLSKKTSIIKRILSKLKEFIMPDIITNGRELDESGYPVNDIGIFYVGDLKSEKRIAQLEEEIASLTGLSDSDSKKRLAKLKNSLVIENNKLIPEQLKYDLVESLVQGMHMATNYDVMKSVESSLLIAQEYIHNKKFFKGVDKFGDPIKNADGEIEYKNEESKIEKRLGTWMRMIFYNNSQVNNTQLGKLASLGKRMTSLTLQGFNVFSAVNNIVTAEGNQVIEGFGGRFYKNTNYHKASMMMGEHLTKAQWMSHLFKQPDKYTSEKPYDKLTAIVEHFNFLEEHNDRGGGIKQKQTPLQYAKSFNWMYALIEGGEYQAQVRSALALLDATTVKYEGAEVLAISLLDAYEFDESAGKLSLKEGVTFSDKDKREMTNKIRNMNKFIHGNYSSNDKVAIQESWYGELAYQFKKWIPNAARSRFSKQYYDESTGMENEGRYRAVVAMFNNITNLASAFNGEAYSKLNKLEQANMRKNAAELGMYATAIALYIIFDAIRNSIPPDDEKTRAAFNFLKKQADRSRGEIDFFLNPLQWYSQAKNPVAGLSIIKESGEFISAVAQVPFYTIQGKTEKLRYEKGINKGMLKTYKEGRDLVPGLRTLSQWDQLDITGNFFIK